MTPHEYLDHKMALCLMFDCRTTSGHRSEWWNRWAKIKGHPESRHKCFTADDFVLRWRTDVPAFQKECRRRGLVCVDEKDHLHVQGG